MGAFDGLRVGSVPRGARGELQDFRQDGAQLPGAGGDGAGPDPLGRGVHVLALAAAQGQRGSVPQECGNSSIRQARLRILGGCSTANTMIAWRPRVADLQEWVDLEASASSLLDFFLDFGVAANSQAHDHNPSTLQSNLRRLVAGGLRSAPLR
jgi:hypothetical protein